MGTSTDAVLCYGVALWDEGEAPWERLTFSEQSSK